MFYQIFNLLEFIVFIIIIIALYQIEKKVNCSCIDNNLKKGIKEWFIFVVIFRVIIAILFYIYFIYLNNVFIMNYIYYSMIIGIPYVIITIIMLVRLFLYLRYLKDECKCAYDNKEKFLYYYLIIYFSIALFIITVNIISIIVFLTWLLSIYYK